jgi:hypothetical protein
MHGWQKLKDRYGPSAKWWQTTVIVLMSSGKSKRLALP